MDDITFGLTLKRLREAAGLTQPQLAKAISTTTRTVSRLETGEVSAKWPMVVAICKSLRVSCEEFAAPVAKKGAKAGRGRPKNKAE